MRSRVLGFALLLTVSYIPSLLAANSVKKESSIEKCSFHAGSEKSCETVWQTHDKEILGGMAALLMLFSLVLVYIFISRRAMLRSMKLYQAIPGRIGVCNRKEKILFFHADTVISDADKVKWISDVPHINYPEISQAIATVFRTKESLNLEYDFENTRRSLLLAPLDKSIFGTECVVWFSHDCTELYKARIQTEQLMMENKATLDRLRDLFDEYLLMLDNMPAYVMTQDIDNDFRITGCNRYCEKLFGKKTHEITGHTVHELFPNPHEADLSSAMDKKAAILENRSHESVQNFTGTDGKTRIGKFFRKVLKTQNGQRLLFTLITDITELREAKQNAEETAERFELTLHSIGDAVLTTDEKGYVTMLNPVAEQLTGCIAEEAIGKQHGEVFRLESYPDGKPISSPLIRALRDGESAGMTNHTDLHSLNGKYYHIACNTAPIRNEQDKIIGAILVFRDVTEEYNKRDQLHDAMLSLDYATELTRSAAFRYDPTTDQIFGSKLLKELWPQENGVPMRRKDWIYSEDLEQFNRAWDKLHNTSEETVEVSYRSIFYGDMRYFRIKAGINQNTSGLPQITGVIQDVTDITKNAVRLKDTLELWDIAINLVPFLFFAKNADDDFRYILCNKALENFIGCKKEEIIGKKDSEIFPQEEATCFHATNSSTMEHENGEDYEEYASNSEGVLHRFRTIKKPFTGADGKRILLGASIDITELHNHIENEKVVNFCLETFFKAENIPDAIQQVLCAVTSHMKASHCYILKLDTDKYTADTFAEYSTDDLPPLLKGQRNVPFEQKEKWFQTLLRREEMLLTDLRNPDQLESIASWKKICKERDIRSAYLAGIHIDGKLWGDLGLIYEKKSYAAFSDLNMKFLRATAHLIELLLLRERSKEELVDALRKAQAADKAKSFFIASVSHEIRTPLNAVIGFAELLKDNEIDSKTQKEYLDSIAFSGNALLQLINDVLDLSKLEADQMQIEPEITDFEELIQEVVKVFAHRIKEKKLEFNVEFPTSLPKLKLDKLRMRQILFNLLGNAVKFTEQGSVTLKVKFSVTNNSEGILDFSIRDTGPGIDEADQTRLMEPFVQLSGMRGTNATNNGTGLGLPITKRLAEKMGGKLQLESKPGRGSTFRIILFGIHFQPDVPQTGIMQRNKNAKGLGTLSVLLVDDVEMNLKVMQAMCRKLGIGTICLSSSATEALRKLEAQPFDLILTDMWMPEMNGAQFARTLRKDPRFSTIPIVAITADMEAKDNFVLNAFNEVLLKPMTIEKVKGMFSRIFPEETAITQT